MGFVPSTELLLRIRVARLQTGNVRWFLSLIKFKDGQRKIAAQVGHGAVLATMKAGEKKPMYLEKWLASGQKKVCVKGTDAAHLLDLQTSADSGGILTTLVHDAGHTQIPSGSLTVLALGPHVNDILDDITGELKLL